MTKLIRVVMAMAVICTANAMAPANAESSKSESSTLFSISERTARRASAVAWKSVSGDSIVAQHDIVLDLDVLFGTRAKPSLDESEMPRVNVGQTFKVSLPEVERPVEFRVDKVSEYVPGVLSFSGQALDLRDVFFNFSEENGRVLGKILLGSLSFVIEPALGKSSGHTLTALDRGLFERAPEIRPEPSEISDEEIARFTQRSTTGSGEVRTLFLFANNISNPSLIAANVVSEFNAALSRSGVASSNRLSSAGVRVVSSSFGGNKDCKGKLLGDMHLRNGVFSSIDQWMSDDHADIAFLVVRTVEPFDAVECDSSAHWNVEGRIGGLSTGFFPGESGISDLSTSPFSISADTYVLGDLTALHEIGHSLGGDHANRPSFSLMPSAASFAYSDRAFGIENDNAGQWQSIMGGYTTTRCVFDVNVNDPSLQPCERIAYFSNPHLTAVVNGQTVVIGTTSTGYQQWHADMETWLENTGMPIVSGYRPDPPPPSAAPSLNVHTAQCYGAHAALWTSVSGADYYKLESFPSSSATTGGTTRYSGPRTDTGVTVPSGTTWYLRVSACNASGCGPLSNVQSATFYNGCVIGG